MRQLSLIYMAGLGLLTTVLVACAHYTPKPLPPQSANAVNVSQLRGANGNATWDMATLERLVLLNNPDLRSARAQHQLAQAQWLQAGLLPNPVVSGSVGFLISGPGNATAWAASLTEDVGALLTLKLRHSAALADAQAIDANLLWQEWQTVAKGRLLLVDLVEGQRLYQAQQVDLDLLDKRRAEIEAAISQGLLDRNASAPELSAASDAEVAQNDLAQQQMDLHNQLCALLGLQPSAHLPLPDSLALQPLKIQEVHNEESTLARRRPDLVALQLGYQSQEAALREQVLVQFPGLSLGYATSSDNSRAYNGGPAISLSLPVFDRNQQGIAAATVTREQLRIEYMNRVASAHDDIDALEAQYQLGDKQRQHLAAQLDEDASAKQVAAAWSMGQIDLHTYAELYHAAFVRRSQMIALEQAQLERQVAMQTLLGTGMPSSLPEDVVKP